MSHEIIKELGRERLSHEFGRHLAHRHIHAHVPHTPHIDLSQPAPPLLPACITASMAAHPVGWAIGGLVAVGALAYFIFKD